MDEALLPALTYECPFRSQSIEEGSCALRRGRSDVQATDVCVTLNENVAVASITEGTGMKASRTRFDTRQSSWGCQLHAVRKKSYMPNGVEKLRQKPPPAPQPVVEEPRRS